MEVVMNNQIRKYNKDTAPKRSYSIRSRFRFCVFLTLLFMTLLSVLTAFSWKGSAMNDISVIEVQVGDGDTLWNIAGKTLPKRRDIRDYIMEIKEFNELDDANINTGQSLLIPVYDHS